MSYAIVTKCGNGATLQVATNLWMPFQGVRSNSPKEAIMLLAQDCLKNFANQGTLNEEFSPGLFQNFICDKLCKTTEGRIELVDPMDLHYWPLDSLTELLATPREKIIFINYDFEKVMSLCVERDFIKGFFKSISNRSNALFDMPKLVQLTQKESWFTSTVTPWQTPGESS